MAVRETSRHHQSIKVTMGGGSGQPSFIFPLVLGCYTLVSYVFLVAVYTVQPTPFIDEIFHVPQAQKYCTGKFDEWDPKITTLPGLYLFSIGLNGPASWLLGRPLCDLFSLRVTNLVAAAFTLSALHKLLSFLHGAKIDGWKVMLSGVNLSLLPILYWYTFLYYTDMLATLVVLVMVLLHLHRAHTATTAMGVVAVVMRQTNIIWVLFLCVLLAADVLGARVLKAPINTVTDARTLVRRLRKTAAKPHRLAEVLADVVVECFGYGLVLVGFVVFVWYNGSIVMGDRSAHTPTVHLPQLGYFCLFFLFLSMPHIPYHITPFLKVCRRRPWVCVAVLAAGLAAVHSNTLVHPYLLADNRHLTFYLWNRIYARYALARYLMVPVYMFGGFMVHSFMQSRSLVFQLSYASCVIAVLVPQKLLEPRYFILPFLLARMQTASRSWWLLWAETLYFLLINCATLYLFMTKTFTWEDNTELQRIIW